MKSYTHEYRLNAWPSACKVYIKDMDSVIWIGFENIKGTSVTNASELIATQIVEKEGLDPSMCRFFEWYPEYGGDLDEIEYIWENNKARRATWKRFCNKESNPFFE